MISTSRRGLDRLSRKTIFELGTLELAVQTGGRLQQKLLSKAHWKKTENESEGRLETTSREMLFALARHTEASGSELTHLREESVGAM